MDQKFPSSLCPSVDARRRRSVPFARLGCVWGTLMAHRQPAQRPALRAAVEKAHGRSSPSCSMRAPLGTGRLNSHPPPSPLTTPLATCAYCTVNPSLIEEP